MGLTASERYCCPSLWQHNPVCYTGKVTLLPGRDEQDLSVSSASDGGKVNFACGIFLASISFLSPLSCFVAFHWQEIKIFRLLCVLPNQTFEDLYPLIWDLFEAHYILIWNIQYLKPITPWFVTNLKPITARFYTDLLPITAWFDTDLKSVFSHFTLIVLMFGWSFICPCSPAWNREKTPQS